MKKGISIVIAQTNSLNSWHVFISSLGLKIIAAGAALLLLGFVIAIVNYGRISYRAIEAEVLRQRNADIEREFGKLTEIKRHLEVVEHHNRQLRVMLGIDKTPPPVEPITGDAASGYRPDTDTAAPEPGTIPSLMPTIGKISKYYSVVHQGLDFAAPLLTPVSAAAPGRVQAAGWDSLYGNYVIIEHTRAYTTFYGHLHTLSCKTDDPVAGGQIIGTVGSSGRSSSPHLHYEVRLEGKPVDPMAYLPHLLNK